MITSVQNPFVKSLAALKTKKGRDSDGLFMVEGEKFVSELPMDWEVRCFVISESYSGNLKGLKERAEVRLVSEAVFKAVSDTVTPQGILAVARQKKHTPELLRNLPHPLVLICESIQDPGNLGTLLRTADASGCDCVILSKGSVDMYNPKVLRSAAGSVFHVPVAEDANITETLKELHRMGMSLFAASPSGEKPAHEADFCGSCGIMIGNEGRGLSDEATALVQTTVRIPMPGRAESLNASVAGAMLMYEAVRQRLLKHSSV